MSAETVAGLGPAAETVIVPDAVRDAMRQAHATALAYAGVEYFGPTELLRAPRHSWRDVGRIAACIAFACIAVAVAIAVIGSLGRAPDGPGEVVLNGGTMTAEPTALPLPATTPAAPMKFARP